MQPGFLLDPDVAYPNHRPLVSALERLV